MSTLANMTNSIIMLAGLPGTGKSTIASKLEDILDYDMHSVFSVRRDLGHKRYNPSKSPLVYIELYRRVLYSLDNKKGVILDAVFAFQQGRKIVYDIALLYAIDVLIIECLCSEKEAKKRIISRPKNDGLFVEPRNPKTYDKIAKLWENLNDDISQFSNYPLSYIRYDTEKNLIERIKVNRKIKPIVDQIASTLL